VRDYYTENVNKQQALGPSRPPPPGAGALAGSNPLLEVLAGHDAALTVPDLAQRLGLHTNTVRTRLAVLIEGGLAEREMLPANGRGRPSHAFAPSAAGRAALRGASVFEEYRSLSAAFAGHLAQAPGDPTEAARAIGHAWGRQSATTGAASTWPQHRASNEAERQILGLLSDLRFDPSPDDDGVALRTCPFLDVAQRVPQVICQVHRGMVEGALEQYGAAGVAVDLVPFSEPGACRLRLG